MSDLLIRHMLRQGTIVLRQADGGPLFRREFGEQVMEEIPTGGKRRISPLALLFFLYTKGDERKGYEQFD